MIDPDDIYKFGVLMGLSEIEKNQRAAARPATPLPTQTWEEELAAQARFEASLARSEAEALASGNEEAIRSVEVLKLQKLNYYACPHCGVTLGRTAGEVTGQRVVCPNCQGSYHTPPQGYHFVSGPTHSTPASIQRPPAIIPESEGDVFLAPDSHEFQETSAHRPVEFELPPDPVPQSNQDGDTLTTPPASNPRPPKHRRKRRQSRRSLEKAIENLGEPPRSGLSGLEILGIVATPFVEYVLLFNLLGLSGWWAWPIIVASLVVMFYGVICVCNARESEGYRYNVEVRDLRQRHARNERTRS